MDATDREGTRQQLHDWFLPGSGFETRVAVVDGVPVGHVTVRGHQQGWTVTDRLIHTVEHAITYDEHVLVKPRS